MAQPPGRPSNGQGQEWPNHQGHPPNTSPFDDPTSLLRVYPFVPYTPTARTAGHLSSHSVTYQPMSSASTLYPQYASHFQRMEHPQHADDYAMRSNAQARVAQALQQGSYGNQPYTMPSHSSYPMTPSPVYPSPVRKQETHQHQYQYQQHQAYPQQSQQQQQQHYPSQYQHQFQQPQYHQPQPIHPAYRYQQQPEMQYSQPQTGQRYEPPAQTMPMPYSFLPRYPQQPSTNGQPPTPSSISAPSPVPSATDYFENFIDQRLRLHSPSSASQASQATPTPAQVRPPKSKPKLAPPITTPTPVRKAPPPSSPDPLSIISSGPGPSPAKKQKSSALSRASPTPGPSSKPMNTTPTISTAKALAHKSASSVSDFQRSTVSMQSTPAVQGEESDDGIDWGAAPAEGDAEMDNSKSFVSPIPYGETAAATSARTGDKDQRSTLQKLNQLLEDIFEEFDGFSAAPSIHDVQESRYFEALSVDGEHPLLAVPAIDRLVRYAARLQSGKKSPRVDNAAVGYDVDSLTRLLHMLERVMRDAQDVIPFPDDGKRIVVQQTTSPKKKKGPKANENGHEHEATPETEMSQQEVQQSECMLERMARASIAALCCLVVFASHGLPKQLYSEDILALAVTSVREEMTKVLFPIIEGLAGEKMQSNYQACLVNEEALAVSNSRATRIAASFKHSTLTSIAQTTCAAVPHIAHLVSRRDISFSDSLVIQTVYLAIGPVFVVEPASRKGRGRDAAAGATWSVMKSLRMEAMACLRGIFARYEEQRQWIIEEILGSLGKSLEQGSAQTRYQLQDGASINTLSALLLQLIQASSHGVAAKIRKLRSRHLEADTVETDQQATTDEEGQVMADVVEASLRATRVIALYLVQKASSTKATKAAQDTDYKSILDAFVADLLQIVYRPEWPAAALSLSVLSKILMTALEETKVSADANAARSVALDYLGNIAARLRALHLDMQSRPLIPSLDEVIAEADVDGLANHTSAQNVIHGYLSACAREDSMFTASGELTQILWAQELQSALRKAQSVVERLTAENDEAAQQTKERLQTITQSLRKAYREVWAADEGLFDITDNVQASEALESSLAVSRCRTLQGAFDPILHGLITSMDSSVVGLRSKALRGLSTIVVVDPQVLTLAAVREAIEERLADSSPAVRDAAVDLIGKYVVQKAELALQYYPHIALRVTDSGLSVRKRVVKLLRDIFNSVEDEDLRVKICCKLIVASEDEDDGVKDLALKSLSDILYPSPSFSAKTSASLLVDVIREFEGSLESLESTVQGVSQLHSGDEGYFAKTIDAIMTRMTDATEDADFDATSHIRAIHLLGFDDPALIDTNKASVLLTYLRPATNSEESRSNDLLLQIFARSIPHMSKASATFAQDLTKTVRAMINRPTGGYASLRQPVACYCSIVNHLTYDYIGMLALLRSCSENIRAKGPAAAASPQISMLYYIVALIAEHTDLDAVASKDDGLRQALDKITQKSLAEHLFDLFLNYSEIIQAQQVPILCLGALFRAHPRLIHHERTLQWMKNIFMSKNIDSKHRLLDLIRDFLVSEAKRRGTVGPKTKNVKDLIGAASELHESTVSTALVQTNIEYVIEAAKSHNAPLQTSAMDVLAFTINQGLYHPLQLLPLLISLETSEDDRVATDALNLHATLHTKHPTLLNVRYLEFARASYDYQRTITSEVSGHRRGVPLLAGWYSLLSEKRAWRMDFLKAITRAFEFDLMGQEEIDPEFVLYLAENLAVLDYQLQEEVMLVVKQLSQVVSDGSAVANAIEQGRMEGSTSEPLEGKAVTISESEQISARRLGNASNIVGLALLTKNLLIDVYGIAEDKCLKLQIGKKSTVGDKPVSRRIPDPTPLDYSRLPLVRGLETIDDYMTQQTTILQLMREDGSLGWSV